MESVPTLFYLAEYYLLKGDQAEFRSREVTAIKSQGFKIIKNTIYPSRFIVISHFGQVRLKYSKHKHMASCRFNQSTVAVGGSGGRAVSVLSAGLSWGCPSA